MNIKSIFVVCYYSNLPVIKAAKDMGIKVIEIQHGIIGKSHPAYNTYLDLDHDFFPDYLLVFGKQDVKTFKNSKLISYKNVYPVGSFYLHHIKNNFKPDYNLIDQLKKWKRIVGVTLQLTVETSLINFINDAASLDDDIGYILIPRQPIHKNYSLLNLPKNVMVITKKDFYELMMYVDLHATVYSTCALEAPSLGVPNILVNINNLSKTYFKNTLTNERINKYVDTPSEFVKTVHSFNKLDRKEIYSLNEDIIVLNYKENVRKIIKKLWSEIS